MVAASWQMGMARFVSVGLFPQHDIQPFEQGNRFRQGELCLLQPVLFHVDGVINGVIKIRFGQIAVDKAAVHEIRAAEHRARQVHVREIHLFGGASVRRSLGSSRPVKKL